MAEVEHEGAPGYYMPGCECRMCECYARIVLQRPDECSFDEYD